MRISSSQISLGWCSRGPDCAAAPAGAFRQDPGHDRRSDPSAPGAPSVGAGWWPASFSSRKSAPAGPTSITVGSPADFWMHDGENHAIIEIRRKNPLDGCRTRPRESRAGSSRRCRRARNFLSRSSRNHIGSVDSHALRMLARRAECSLMANASPHLSRSAGTPGSGVSSVGQFSNRNGNKYAVKCFYDETYPQIGRFRSGCLPQQTAGAERPCGPLDASPETEGGDGGRRE